MKSPDRIEESIRKLRYQSRPETDQRILADAYRTLEETVGPADAWRGPALRIAVAAVVTVAVVIAAVALLRAPHRPVRQAHREGPSAPAGQLSAEIEGTQEEAEQARARLTEQVEQILLMFNRRDIDGLVQMLDEGEFESKVLAAKCLGILGDERALPALERLNLAFEENPRGGFVENPFKGPIEDINARTAPAPAEPNIPQPQEPPQEKPATDGNQPPRASESILSGHVIDAATGLGIEGIKVCLQGPHYQETETDANGFYRFDQIHKPGSYRIAIYSDEYIGITDYSRMPVVSLSNELRLVKHFQLEPACMVEVFVADEDDQPIEGAFVFPDSLVDERGRVVQHPAYLRQRKTDANGIIMLGGFEPSQTPYFITATHPNYAPAYVMVKLNDPQTIESAAITMKEGVDVRGYAEYRDGVPAGEGIRVSAAPIWWPSTYMPRVYEVEPNGSFTLRNIVPGKYRIKVGIPLGRNLQMMQIVGERQLPLDNELLTVTVPRSSPQASVAISGTLVFEAGRRLRSIRIEARSETGDLYYAEVGDGQDSFTISGLEPGTYRVTFSSPNIQTKTLYDVQAPTDDLEVELTYVETPVVTGTVVTADTGQPIEEFRLRALQLQGLPGSNYVRADNWRWFYTADGRFKTELTRPGIYKLQVIADGFAPALSDEINTGQLEPVTIRLTAGGTIKGRVVDSDGRAVSGAEVIPFSLAGGNDITNLEQFVMKERAVKTTDGNFTLEHLPAGTDTLKVTHLDFAPLIASGIQVIEGQTTEGIELVLTKGAVVEGYVFDKDGTAQSYVTLIFEGRRRFQDDQTGTLATVITDANGFYRVGNLPGQLIYIQRRDSGKALGVVSRAIVSIKGKTTRIDFGGKPQITGQLVVDEEPLADTRVLLSDPVNPDLDTYRCFDLTDNQGGFTFTGVPAGTWAVYYRESSGFGKDTWIKVTTVDVTTMGDIDLGEVRSEYPPLLIQVKTEDPNQALPKTYVAVQDGRGHFGQPMGRAVPIQGKPGLYRLINAEPGLHTLMVSCIPGPMIRLPIEITDETRQSPVTVTIPKGNATLTGAIVNEARLDCILRSADQTLLAPIVPGTDGTYKIENLPAGEYEICQSLFDDMIPKATVNLADGQTTQFDIDTSGWDSQARAFLRTVVTTEAGLLLSGAQVWLEGQAGVVEPVTQTSTSQLFAAEPGLYTLHAAYPGFKEAVQEVLLDQTDRSVLYKPGAAVTIMLKKQ